VAVRVCLAQRQKGVLPAVGRTKRGWRLCLGAEADSTVDQRTEAVVDVAAAAAAAAVAGTVHRCSKRGLSQSSEAEVARGSGTW
jgi:hypothetical protein